MLNPNIQQRITVDQLLKDPVFTKYDENLLEREQQIIDKIKKNPDCWQAASLMYTGDPLIGIFDLTKSIQGS